MASGNTLRNLAVGIVFLGSLAVLGGASLLMSSVSFFRDVDVLEVFFPNADNLEPGDDVLLYGYRIGQVEEILYQPEKAPNPILVRCKLPADVVRGLRPETSFTIRNAGPLGGRQLEITPPAPAAGTEGKEGPSEREGTKEKAKAEEPRRAIRVGEASGDVFRQLEKLVKDNQTDVKKAIQDIRLIVEDIQQGRGVIGQLIQDPVLAANFNSAISELGEIFRKINRGEGTIGALVADEDLRDRVSKAVDDLSKVIADLRKEDGTVGFLLNNKEARDRLSKTIGNLSDIVAEVKQGDGLAARIINSPDLANDVQDTVAKVEEAVEKLNSGSGTLGQLLNNPRAWDELMKILILAREAIEDLREQAPISTFVNALFATF